MKRSRGLFGTGRSLLALAIGVASSPALAVDIAVWTFETSAPVTAGPHSAEGGANAGAISPASGFHTGAAVYSSPTGNGSVRSFSSNTWAIGDYYQFSTSTTGFENIGIAWDQASSNTGPRDFVLQYSTNGTTFTQFGATYTVLANASPNPTWNATTNNAIYHFSVDLSTVPALNNTASVYLRMVMNSTVSANGGVVAGTGTDRVDNVTITGSSNVVGACCYGNGFCATTTVADCTTTYSGNFLGGNTTCSGQCPGTPGACCLPTGACNDVATAAACAGIGGTYQGLNTLCVNTSCPQPSGACCTNGSCTEVTQAACHTGGGIWRGAATTCATACPPVIVPVQSGDIALGSNRALALETLQLIRTCGLLGHWTDFPDEAAFVESMEFDNAFGGAHNAHGNLLGLNFGPPGGPGLLYNVSTDGSDNAELIYTFDTASGLSANARVTGLAVSTDNNTLSIYNVINGSLIFLDYDAGAAIGTGSGASATFLQEVTLFGPGGATSGTAWLDADTVIWAGPDPLVTPNSVSVLTKDVGAGPATFVRTLLIVPANINHVDVEYAPDVSPYVYVMVGSFLAATTNTLFVLDPNTLEPGGPNVGEWSLVGTYDYSTSMQTAREIAMGPDAKLYCAQFSNIVDSIDVNSLANNVSTDCFTSAFSASFDGIDVARSAVSPPACPGQRGDANCDGSVDFFDIDPFLLALFDPGAYATTGCGGGPCCGGSTCAVDTDCTGSVDFFDIDPFLNCLFSGCLPTPPMCAP